MKNTVPTQNQNARLSLSSNQRQIPFKNLQFPLQSFLSFSQFPINIHHDHHDLHTKKQVNSLSKQILSSITQNAQTVQTPVNQELDLHLDNETIMKKQQNQKLSKIKFLAEELTKQLQQIPNQVILKPSLMQFLYPLKQVLIKIDKSNIKKSDNVDKELKNVTKNNYRDLAKIYARIIDKTPAYKFRFEELKNQLGKDQGKKLQQLHKRMYLFSANKMVIILYRNYSHVLRDILDRINKSNKIQLQIMLSNKSEKAKRSFLSRIDQMIQNIQKRDKLQDEEQ